MLLFREQALQGVAIFGIVFTSIGVCVAYVDFIVGVLTKLISCSQYEAMAVLSPFIIALALLRSFRYLAFTSILGDVCACACAHTYACARV